MRIPIEMQQLGPDFESGVIVAWHKSIGESVNKGDVLMEVETEKVDVELPALNAGTLVEITKDVGDEVAVGEIVGYLEGEG